MKYTVTIVIIALFSCQSQQNNANKSDSQTAQIKDTLTGQHKQEALIANPQKLGSFVDSIGKKLVLSIDQIRKHTLIDSIYFTGIFSNASFKGDTVIKRNKGYYIAIIDYDDTRMCIYRFLLVINSESINTDKKIVSTDCDRDESADYTSLNYRLMSDSSFETTETFMPAGKTQKKVEKMKWKVNKDGKISPYK